MLFNLKICLNWLKRNFLKSTPKRSHFIFLIFILFIVIAKTNVTAANFNLVTMTDYTVTDNNLDTTGVTHAVTFTSPAEIPASTYIEFRMYTVFDAALESYCDASLTGGVISVGSGSINANSTPAEPSEDLGNICRYLRIQTEEVISAGEEVTISVADVVNPQTAGSYYLHLNWVIGEEHYNSNSEDSARQIFDDPTNPTLLFKITVNDPDGSPVQNSNVWMHTADHSKHASATTDAQGNAYFFPVNFYTYDYEPPDGDYIVEVYVPTGSEYTNPATQPTVTIETGTVNSDYFTGNSPGPIQLTQPQLKTTFQVPTGCDTCTASAGDAIPYVDTDIVASDMDPSKMKHSSSDANGVIKFGGLPDGTYNLEIRMPYNGSEYLGLTNPSTISNIVISNSGETVTYESTEYNQGDGDFPVLIGVAGITEFGVAKKTVSGRVTKTDGTGVDNAKIFAMKMNASGMSETTTDANGNYSLKIGGGSWNIRPEVDYSPNYDDDPHNDVTATWVFCGMGRNVSFEEDNTEETKTGNFEVKEVEATLQGKVVYPNGDPVTGSASINAFSKDGCGSYANLNWQTGTFSAALPAGTYSVTVSVWNENYSSPAAKSVTLTSGTVDIGTLTLVEKNAQITGRLWADKNGNNQYDSGEGVENVMIDAFKMNKKFDQNAGPGPGPMGDAGGFSNTTSDANGEYTLKVTKGTWMVNVMADMGMMHGGYSETSTNYIYDGAPNQVAISEDNQVSSANNFQLKTANATINGRLWADANDNNQYDDGEGVSNIFGYAFAEASGTFNQGPMMGAGMGAPISRGTFQIKVPAGTYKIGADFPPESTSYTPSGMTEVTVASGGTATANLQVLPNNATVRVEFKDNDGNSVTSLSYAEVFFDNSEGGHQYHMLSTEELSSGYAEMNVSAGIWRVGYYIDPSKNNYMNSPATDNKVIAVKDQTVTKNVVLQESDSSVTGTVKDPNGNPLTGVYVSIDNRKVDNFDPLGGMMLANGKVTDSNGTYSLNLPAGTYQVQAFFPPEAIISGATVNYLNPEPKQVTIDASNPATANFNFKQSDASISGIVTLNGSNQGAFISAYSEKGGYNETTSSNGAYSLNVTKNDTWYVRAFFEDGNNVYLSDVNEVLVGSNDSKTQNLVLEVAPFTVPDSVSTNFNCANAKKVTLSNGAEISIPSGAIQPSSVQTCDSSSANSNVTLTISPTTQMSLQNKSVPIGVGYEISAMDSNGSTISDTFSSNVTITIPYSDQEIETSLGGGEVNESLLGNGYWDTSTSSWRNVSSEVMDTDNNQMTISTNHFTLFGVLAATDPNYTANPDTDSSDTDTTSTTVNEGESKPMLDTISGALIEGAQNKVAMVIPAGAVKWDADFEINKIETGFVKPLPPVWIGSGPFKVKMKSWFNNAQFWAFKKPVVLILRYDPLALGGIPESSLRMNYYDENKKIWVPMDSFLIKDRNEVAVVVNKLHDKYALLGGYGYYWQKDPYTQENKITEQMQVTSEDVGMDEEKMPKREINENQKQDDFQSEIDKNINIPSENGQTQKGLLGRIWNGIKNIFSF